MAERSKACDSSASGLTPLVCLILSGFSSSYDGVGSNPTLVNFFRALWLAGRFRGLQSLLEFLGGRRRPSAALGRWWYLRGYIITLGTDSTTSTTILQSNHGFSVRCCHTLGLAQAPPLVALGRRSTERADPQDSSSPRRSLKPLRPRAAAYLAQTAVSPSARVVPGPRLSCIPVAARSRIPGGKFPSRGLIGGERLRQCTWARR